MPLAFCADNPAARAYNAGQVLPGGHGPTPPCHTSGPHRPGGGLDVGRCACAGGPSANGTWLSQPQIWFYASRGQLERVMAQTARRHGLMPVVWVQSPQYRRMGGADLIHAARHGDGIHVDDHFLANYNHAAFSWLRQAYTKSMFCSIQPFQAALVPSSGCN